MASLVSRTRCGILHAAPQSRDRPKRRRSLRPRLCSAPRREELRAALRPGHGYLVLPSLSYCARNAQRSLASCSFLMPANTILVPGILAFGSLMYSLNVASSQVMPEFLLASL